MHNSVWLVRFDISNPSVNAGLFIADDISMKGLEHAMGGQVLGTNGFARIDGFASLLTGKLEDKPEPSTS